MPKNDPQLHTGTTEETGQLHSAQESQPTTDPPPPPVKCSLFHWVRRHRTNLAILFVSKAENKDDKETAPPPLLIIQADEDDSCQDILDYLDRIEELEDENP